MKIMILDAQRDCYFIFNFILTSCVLKEKNKMLEINASDPYFKHTYMV